MRFVESNENQAKEAQLDNIRQCGGDTPASRVRFEWHYFRPAQMRLL
jgi:hypothetical protein